MSRLRSTRGGGFLARLVGAWVWRWLSGFEVWGWFFLVQSVHDQCCDGFQGCVPAAGGGFEDHHCPVVRALVLAHDDAGRDLDGCPAVHGCSQVGHRFVEVRYPHRGAQRSGGVVGEVFGRPIKSVSNASTSLE